MSKERPRPLPRTPVALAWLRVLGHLNPMYYAVQAARDLAAGTTGDAAVGVGFAVTAALALCWGTRAYQKAMS
jgi:hypothetical protein